MDLKTLTSINLALCYQHSAASIINLSFILGPFHIWGFRSSANHTRYFNRFSQGTGYLVVDCDNRGTYSHGYFVNCWCYLECEDNETCKHQGTRRLLLCTRILLVAMLERSGQRGWITSITREKQGYYVSPLAIIWSDPFLVQNMWGAGFPADSQRKVVVSPSLTSLSWIVDMMRGASVNCLLSAGTIWLRVPVLRHSVVTRQPVPRRLAVIIRCKAIVKNESGPRAPTPQNTRKPRVNQKRQIDWQVRD